MNEVLVSVWCLAYNHEKYIRDAIEGFLSQKTNFQYEVYIHDDASTDGTADIIREYENKYPNIIKGIYQKENLYSKTDSDWHGKKSILQEASKGKYIALCDGDDFWMDQNKLQMQVDYLETHSDCVMAVHDAIMINCITGETTRMAPYQEEKNISSDEIIMQYHGNVPTASAMYRREMLDMSSFFANVGVGDYPLQLYCLTKGKIHYFNKAMSVYRYVGEGAWTFKNKSNDKFFLSHYVRMIHFLEKYDCYTQKKYTTSVTTKKWIYLQNILNRFRNLKNKEFLELCDSCNEKSQLEFKQYYGEIKRIFFLMHDQYYVDRRILSFIKQYSHVVIWGAGQYGAIIANKIRNVEIFEGFVTSNNQEISNEYLGKPVWRINDMPFKISETGIVVAVGIKNWSEIQSNIETIENVNYIYPFVMQN